MESLLKSKEKLIDLYSKYDLYINSITKFLFTMVILFIISNTSGTSGLMGNPGVILVISLVCMFMPKIGITYVTAFYTIAAVFSVSMEYAVVMAFIMLLVALLYMQFSPEYGYLVLISAAACAFNLPVMLVILIGLLAGPAAIVPVACGVLIYYVFSIVPSYMAEVSGAYLDTAVERFTYIINNAVLNKEMYIAAAAAVIVITVVYIVKRLQINYAWRLAAIAGAVLNLVIMLVGGIAAGVSIDVFRLVAGTVVSLILSFIVIFFVRNLDYKRIERVQFEDDEYYYYVKAIPKKTAEKKPSGKRRMVKENFDEGDA